MYKMRKEWHDSSVKRMRKRLSNYDLDVSFEKRTSNCKCKYCTYIDTEKLVQDAFTHTKCRECSKKLVFADSSIDYYCLECAKNLNICKHCGAEMD